jgi:hypothetical protein
MNRPAHPLKRRTDPMQNAASSFGETCFWRLVTSGRSILPLRCSRSNEGARH